MLLEFFADNIDKILHTTRTLSLAASYILIGYMELKTTPNHLVELKFVRTMYSMTYRSV
jgi:hypothetical protein